MKDLSQSAIALIQISDRSKENALRIVRAKQGIAHIIDPLLVLAPIMMDIFQELRVNSKLFFAFLKETGSISSGLQIDNLIGFSVPN